MNHVIIVSDTLHGHLAVCANMKVAKASLEFSYHKAADKPTLHAESYDETIYRLPNNIVTLKRCVVQEETEHL